MDVNVSKFGRDVENMRGFMLKYYIFKNKKDFGGKKMHFSI